MKNSLFLAFIVSLLIHALFDACQCNAAIVNEKAFGSLNCVPYAYGDFNADKFVDIYCVSQPGHRIEIWIAQESMDPIFILYRQAYLKNNSTIVNIVPGDFTGDSKIDMLVVYEAGESTFKMTLFVGNKKSRYENDLEKVVELDFVLLDHPFAADVDGDGKLDLLIYTKNSKGEKTREILKFVGENKTTHVSSQDTTKNELYVGYAHSITDLDDDFTPDLVYNAKSPASENMIFEQWKIDTGSGAKVYKYFAEYDAPENIKFYGQSLFADFDSDGTMEHLLPACKNEDCSESAIYIYKDNKWNELNIDFGGYSFIPPNNNEEFWNKDAAMSVKIGDYDLNGYIDLLMVLKDKNNTQTNEKSAILMKNVVADGNNLLSPSFNRSFKIDNYMTSLFSYTNVVQVSFFDLYDDGYLDVLLTLKETDPNGSPTYRLVAFKNEYFDDVYFIKMMVIPGGCDIPNCPYKNLPYGLNYPGVLVRMETTSYEFHKVVLYATQLSQSGHMSLQLPYTVFGLGATPNFVEELRIGFLTLTSNFEIHAIGKKWQQIIPNSQLVINPNPRTHPFYWKMQLFITPSKNILKTAISLGITMVALVIVIGILQFREKKMDEKERKLESQRFHFDGL